MGEGGSSIYVITQKTKAIMMKDATYYCTQILEVGRKRHSKYKPEQILNHSCLRFGSDLKGRKRAVKDILNTASKLPILIDRDKGVYMIPTASIKRKDCVWLSYKHIKFYEQRDHKMYIGFYDGTGIYVNASYTTIDLQFKRTSEVIVQLNRWKFFGGED